MCCCLEVLVDCCKRIRGKGGRVGRKRGWDWCCLGLETRSSRLERSTLFVCRTLRNHGVDGESTCIRSELVANTGRQGNVATCSSTSLQLHTLNGYFIAELDVSQPILALSFHEREYSLLGVLATAIGGEILLRTWKPKPPKDLDLDASTRTRDMPGLGTPKWEFSTLRALRMQTEGMSVATRMPRVTSLKFVGYVHIQLPNLHLG